MAKFYKQTYYNKTTNEIKVFTYNIPVPKAIVEAVDLQDKEVKISTKDGKIIIEEKIIDK